MIIATSWRTWLKQMLVNLRPCRTPRRRTRQVQCHVERFECRQVLTGSISGTVFDDVNGDKIKQATEVGVAGVIVFIDADSDGVLDPDNIPDGGATEVFAVSASDGTFTLSGLPAGTAHVRIRVPGTADLTRDVVLLADENKTNVNLAVSLGVISGTVFDDADQDGTKQATEPGHGGVAVFIDANGNNALDPGEPQAVTNADGSYILNHVLPGAARIRAVAPANFVAIPKNATIASGQALTAQNVALNALPGTVSGTVFIDLDANGQINGAESGQSGVSLFLDLNNDGLFNNNDRATTTDGSGNYSFTQVVPGSFQVRATAPAGYTTAPLPVTLTAGQTLAARNVALLAQTGSVSGTVFVDANGDGLINGADAVQSGITVFLDFNSDGVFNNNDRAAISDASGNYSFTQIVAGTFQVRALPPAGYSTSPLGVTLKAGQALTGKNVALLAQTGSVSGTLFVDANGDGLLNGTDAGLSGVTVFLDFNSDGLFNNNDRASISDASGNYSFAQVVPGTFQVRALPPAGYSTSPLGVTLTAGQALTAKNVALVAQTGTVSGTVFIDLDANGQINGSEVGRSIVTVFLDLNSDGVFNNNDRATVTDGSGNYTFSQVALGSFQVRAVPPAGYSSSPLNLTLTGAQNLTGRNLPLQGLQTGTVSGIVFDDLDRNGLKSSSETGHSGSVTVYLDLNGNGAFETGEPTTFTIDGVYSFTNIAPGQTRVRVVPPTGFTAVPAELALTLVSNQVVTAANFALQSVTGSITGIVFDDTDHNGLRSGQESGHAMSVAVFLDLNNNGIFDTGERSALTSMTGTIGQYQFLDVSSGPVRVRIVPPAGVVAATPVLDLTLGAGQAITTADFALQQAPTASISGLVFDDTDRNGIISGVEGGHAGNVAVFLDLNQNEKLDVGEPTTFTQSGAYSFTGLPAGPVQVRVVPPDNFSAMPALLNLVLVTGQSTNTANFALQSSVKGTISGTVFLDYDRNGLKTSSEPGKSGTIVFLDGFNSAPNGVRDPMEPWMESNSAGAFQFVDVPLGNYDVVVVPSAAYVSNPIHVSLGTTSVFDAANVGLQLKLQLSQTPVVYTAGTPAVQVANNALISGLVAAPTDVVTLNIKVAGLQKRDNLVLAPTVGSPLFVSGSSANSEIRLGSERIGRITTLSPGRSISLTFDAGKFSAEALHEILDSVRFNAVRSRKSNTSTVQVQLQIGQQTYETTRKLQVLSRKK